MEKSPLGRIVRNGKRLGLDLHAGDFNTPKALERCPVLQSEEKWAHAVILAHHSASVVSEGEAAGMLEHS